jgi:hypothetical protein
MQPLHGFSVILALAAAAGLAVFFALHGISELKTAAISSDGDGANLSNASASLSSIEDCLSDIPRLEDCADSRVEKLLETKSTKDLLAELDSLGKSNGVWLQQCHPVVHVIGRMTFKKAGTLHAAFAACDQTCHSGCYHGAMERSFGLEDEVGGIHSKLPAELIMEKAPTVCATGFEELSLKFQCLHGLGHAVLFFLSYNISTALAACDTLPENWDRQSCYGGLFMENIVAADKSKRYLNSDPHFPCNALDAKYGYACYQMQTSRMLELGLSYPQIAAECAKAGNFTEPCFVSMGRDASNIAREDASRAVPICTVLQNQADRQACIRGLIAALNDNTWDGRYSFPLCATLPDDMDRGYCYDYAVYYLLTILRISAQAVKESCLTHGGGVAGCLAALEKL